MDDEKNHLQKLANIVSNESQTRTYDTSNSILPDKYNELIKIDQDIIKILNKIEGEKPIKYELLGKFQKMFLLNKNELDTHIELVETLSQKFKYLLQNQEKEKALKEKAAAEKAEEARKAEEKAAKAAEEAKKAAEEAKKAAEEAAKAAEEATKAAEEAAKAVAKKAAAKAAEEAKKAAEEKAAEEKAAEEKAAERQKQTNLTSEKRSIMVEFERKIRFIKDDVKKKKNFKFINLKKYPNFKNMELKTKIIDFIKKYGIEVTDSIDNLTLSQIYEQVFNKEWEDKKFKFNPQTTRSNKYKKLLKDINYIKKYMKYKMKYNILLKK